MGQSGAANDSVETGATVLVVDDDPAIRKLVGARLRHAEYQTREAENGRAALALIEKERVDLVLLDLMMPELDGFQTLEALRRTYTFAKLPVIILSAKDGSDDVIAALRAGANDYAVKPPDFGLLLKRVKVHLDLKTTADKRVGPYLLRQQLGAGGMGIVYEAEDTRSGEVIALKVLPRAQTLNPEFVGRFTREATFAAQVRHPHIVGIHDAGNDGETYYIAMELVRGRDLGEIAEAGPIAWRDAATWIRQIASALAALKDLGIVHRDIKPDNILIDREGRAKLTDFGVARDLGAGARITQTGIGIGSVTYASPEQMRGGGDHRADIYSLGCTLYFLLTGRDAFSNTDSIDVIFDKKLASPPSLSGSNAPTPLHRLVKQMIQPVPSRRPQYYQRVIQELDDALSQQPTRPRRSLLPWVISLVAFAAGLALWQALSWG